MGINWADHTVEIDAPIGTCFDAIVDYESFPRWQGSVISTEVKSRTEEGLGERVRLFLSAKGQKVDYTLDYSYDRPTEIRWDFVEGNGVDDVDGVYTFEQLDGDRTRATYKLGIDPSLPVPGIVARRIHSHAMKKSVEELKDEAERRHREQGDREPEQEVPPAPEPEPEPEPIGEPEPIPRPEPEPEPIPRSEPEPMPRPEPELPQETASPRRDLAGDAIRTARGVAGLALGLARGAAGAAVGIGRETTGAVTGRVSRLLDRDRDRS